MPGVSRPGGAARTSPAVIGLIGTLLVAAVVTTTLSLSTLPLVNGGDDYRAVFSGVGNLDPGDDVVVAGVAVGSVDDIELVKGRAEVSFHIEDPDVILHDRTTAAISTRTLLGKRGLKLDSRGTGPLRPGSVIPMSRTTGPYDLTDALSGLTTEVDAVDSASVSRALETLTDTFSDTPPELRRAVTSLSDITEQVADRDDSLVQLLDAAESVTGVLDDRNRQVRTLLDDGASLLAEVHRRREAVVQLLTATQGVAQQLSGLVRDNRADLQPALVRLRQVTALLNRNKENLERIISGAGIFGTTLGEALGSGPFFSAYVQNLVPPTSLLPGLTEIQ